MLVEIRRYRLHPRRRDELVEWFEATAVPEMERHGMHILGSFVDLEDPDVFVYILVYEHEDERQCQTDALYASRAWLDGMNDKASEMKVDCQVSLMYSTPGSRI